MLLVVLGLMITILIFTAAVIHRAHLPQPSTRVPSDADVTAAARAATLARLHGRPPLAPRD